jgi:hypothetical protein
VRRSILLALVAALALALVANVTTAVADGAQTAAKKKAAKKCAKPKKGKNKAGKSLADSAAKKKGKKKAACKPKAKKKGKAQSKLADGKYSHDGTTLTVSNGGTTAQLGTPLSCFVYNSENVPLTNSSTGATASEDRNTTVVGEPAHIKWSLTVKPTLDYKLEISWDVGGGICKSEKTVNGKFVKTQ